MLLDPSTRKLLDVSTTATPSPKEATAMFTTLTTQDVRFHGWTLPKGSEVTVESITIDLPGEVTSVTATTPCYEWHIGLPAYALPTEVWNEVPVLRYCHATGRTVPV